MRWQEAMTPQDIYDFHVWFSQTYQQRLKGRYGTWYQALMLAVARNAKTIVETGTSRAPGNWGGDGQSTIVLASFAQRYGCKLHTCDLEPAAIAAARESTAPFSANVEYHVGDSVAFLSGFQQPIDLLYLDSMDFDINADPHPPQEHALREAQAAMHALHAQSIVLLDDCNLPHGGKGAQAIPFLLGQGWHVIGMNYQVLMTHAFCGGILDR
jgi:hypothetical protein